MSAHAWVTDFMGDPSLMLMYQTDLSEKDVDASIAGIQALERGMPVPPENRPAAVWPGKRGKHRAKLPPLFCTNGFWVISQEVAGILLRFDLGEGALSPVVVLGKDNKTPVEGAWYCWIFGNRKDTLDAESSVNLKVHSPVPDDPWRKLASHPADDDAAFTRDALKGPDVWIETRLKRTVVLSGQLGDALVAAGLRKDLRMTRARVT